MYHPSLEPHINYATLQDLIMQCQAYLDWPAEKLFEVKSEVSGWSIANHLHHLARAHSKIPRLIERLQSGQMGEEGVAGDPVKLDLIHNGIAIRGFQSPQIAVPPDDLTFDVLVQDFSRMAKSITRLEHMLDNLAATTFSFPHLYYGPLNALEWLRFLGIHTRHHLGIIKEIEVG